MKKKKSMSGVKKRRLTKFIVFIIEIIVVIALFWGLYHWLKISGYLGRITHEDLNEENLGVNDATGTQNIALFGLDNRTMGNLSSGNADVIMVLSIDNDSKEIDMISVYRDTYLAQQEDVDGEYSYRKANAAFAYGGPEETIRMLNTNLDLDITDYVTVDFQALVDAINAVDGVKIKITDKEASLINKRIDEIAKWTGVSSSHLDGAGTYNLDGVQATAYCRLRKTALGDLGRAQRQRKVLGKLFKKVRKGGIDLAEKVIDAVVDEISTSLTDQEILSLASTVVVNKYNIGDTAGFPFDMTTATISGAGSVDIPCTLESNVQELFEKIFGNEDYTVSSKVKEISNYIINRTGKDENDAANYALEDDELSDKDSSGSDSEDSK